MACIAHANKAGLHCLHSLHQESETIALKALGAGFGRTGKVTCIASIQST